MIRQLTTIVLGATAVLGHGGKNHTHETPVHHTGQHELVDVPQCLDGFIRRGGYCVRPVPIPQEPVCPEGTFDDGSACLLLVDGNVQCPQGAYVGNLFCRVTSQIEGSLECPKGSTASGDECLVGGLVSYCPAGYAEGPQGMCIKTTPVEFSCAVGLKDTGDLCQELETAPIEPICPDGAQLVGGICEVSVEVAPACPAGFSDEGERCAAFEAAIRDVCPDGYAFDPEEFSCVKFDQQPSVAECEGGAVLIDGKCERIIEAPTQPVCERGQLVNDICEITTRVPPGYECPTEYELQHTKKGPVCTREVQYDCSYSEYKCKDEPFALPKQHKPAHEKASHNGHAKPRHLKGKPIATHDKEHEKKYGYCHKEEVLIPRRCDETLVAEAIPQCEAGIFDGSACIIGDVFPPVERCTGVIRDGKCIAIEMYQPVYRCSDEYSPIGAGAICEKLIGIEGPAERCPSGTVEFQGKCAIFVDKACPAAGCVETITWAPEDICPVGFTLVRVSPPQKAVHTWGTKPVAHHKIEKACVRTTFTEKQSTCPEGYKPISDTTCAAYADKIIVDEEKKIAAQFLCPIGYEAIDKTCVQIGFIGADVLCPSDFAPILNTEVCYKEEAEELGCPKGSHEIAGECFVDATSNPILVPKQLLKVVMKKMHGKPFLWQKPTLKLPDLGLDVKIIGLPKATLPPKMTRKVVLKAPHAPKMKF